MFGALWLLLSTFASAWSVSWIVQIGVLYQREKRIKKVVTASEFHALDRDHDKQVSMYEFVIYKLQQAHPDIEDRLIRKLEQQFEDQADYLAGLEQKATNLY